ncbi:MAG: 6-pyruvoyl-tetrahydropterin synthase-related protein [Gammaproteobacteria bacterium]|nr:6-pyruvoyl-tetrahydropterin synthase-related protein [Gammaproteobacteria bacterium]
MRALSLKQSLLLVLFLGLIAVSMLSPIASHRYLPDSPDFAIHTGAIVQAKTALKDGQFPLRTVSWQDNHFGNAFFTYYSPLPYMISGTLYKIMPGHGNPYSALKATLWFFILLAGLYIFKLTYWLFRSMPVALLSSVVYMLSPYFLININTRGDFTEAVGQGLIPVVLYYTLKSFKEPNLRLAIFAAVAWTSLLTSHLVTFVYTSFFIGLFLICLTLRDRTAFKRLLWTGVIYLFGCVLALWYLMPIALTTRFLLVYNQLTSPMKAAWLTPLPTLLSVGAVSPVPLPGNNELPMALYASVGWPILFAVFLLSYLLIQKRLFFTKASKKTIAILIALFGLAFFIIWSPINFWRFVPEVLAIAQFSYRLLSQTMWIGTLLFGFALLEIFRGKLDYRYVAFGVVIIGLTSSTWLPTNKSGALTVDDIIKAPSLGYSQHAYLISPNKLPQLMIAGQTDLPLVTSDNWLLLNQPITLPATLATTPRATLHLVGTLPPELFTAAVKLTLFINGQATTTETLQPGNFELNFKLHHAIPANAEKFTLAFSLDKPYVPKLANPNFNDARLLGVMVRSIQVENLSSELNAMSVTATQPDCAHHNTLTVCHIHVTPEATLVQLPSFYYPGLLRVKVNGEQANYLPLLHRDQVLTGLRLAPGNYEITVEFVGITWANWISGIAWIVILVSLITMILLRCLERDTEGKLQQELS